MGHIKEPVGVDILIKSRTLTLKEEIAIDEYIRSYKATHLKSAVKSKKVRKTSRNRRKENSSL